MSTHFASSGLRTERAGPAVARHENGLDSNN